MPTNDNFYLFRPAHSHRNDLQWLPRLPHLETLCLQEMPLKSLHGIERHPALQRLEIGQATLRSLDGIQSSKSVSALSLAGMRRLESIEQACGMRSLRNLALDACKLVRDIQSISTLAVC